MDNLDLLLSAFLPKDEEAVQNEDNAAPDLLGMLAKLAPIISALNDEGDETRLLRALHPYLSEKRREKAQEAEQLLRVFRLLPLITQAMKGDDGNE